jgi:hypothetical protein
MQQRRLRLGDILDDYCPRERRITNHAVVAIVDDEVRQTRCTTCDAEHEYKQARVPSVRRKKKGETPAVGEPALAVPDAAGDELPFSPPAPDRDLSPPPADTFLDPPDTLHLDEPASVLLDDDGPVHRPLIRATLPRPEGQTPERKAPDFTIRQPGGRFDPLRGGRQRGRHQRQGQTTAGGPPSRFGGPRQSGNPPGQQPRHGNRAGNAAGGRPQGAGRGPRQGSGPGRKRGR